jgi:flagellar hook-associated protein 2
MSTTSTTSSLFNGNSRYAQDFQAVIDRSVAIASLPISQLNHQKTAFTDQATALTAIDGKFSALQTAVQNLGQALNGSSFQTTVSDPATVSATAGAGAMEGSYSIKVNDVGAYASSMTASAWDAAAPDPGPTTTYQLKVGSDTIDIATSDNQAATVAALINEKAGDKVRATVVNVGGAASPDFRISLQSVRLGDLTPRLEKDGVDLQQEQTVGRVAKYTVNNSGTVVESDTRSVTSIAPGLTVNLLASKPASAVDITVSRSSSAVSDALSAFAAAYNTTLDEIDKQRGENQGALSGQSVVYSLSESLRGLATYGLSGGSITGLADLGLTLGADGRLTFDQFAFTSADISSSAGVTAFLGSADNSGFLKWATDTLNSVEAADTGTLKGAEALVQGQITDTDSRIAAEQASVDSLKERLQTQMAAADALIASMEQQYNYLYSLFQSMDAASQQYK